MLSWICLTLLLPTVLPFSPSDAKSALKVCMGSGSPTFPTPTLDELKRMLSSSSSNPEILPLLTCWTTKNVTQGSTSHRYLLYESAARKYASLLSATLQREKGLLLGLPGKGGFGGSPEKWNPLHAALSNKLHVLTLVKDVLQYGSGVDAQRQRLLGLVTNLLKHSSPKDTVQLQAAIATLGLNASSAPPSPAFAHAAVAASGEGTGLIQEGALLHTVAVSSLSPIANALSLQLLRLLLSSTGAPAARGLAQEVDGVGRTPLFLAAASGSATAVRILLGYIDREGPLPVDALGLNPLHLSCAVHSWDAVGVFLEWLGESRAPPFRDPSVACQSLWGEYTLPLALAEVQQGAVKRGIRDTKPPRKNGDDWKKLDPLFPLPPSLNDYGTTTNDTTLPVGTVGADEEFTALHFLSGYYARGLPVLVKGGATHLPMDLSKQSLLSRAGGVNVTVGPIPYGKLFSPRSPAASTVHTVTLAQYVHSLSGGGSKLDAHGTLLSPPDYVFEALDPRVLNNYPPIDLVPHWAKDAVLLEGGEGSSQHTTPLISLTPPPKSQFFLGPPGSGAPFHFHKDAINLLAHGRKRWWLIPPSTALYSTLPVLHWALSHGNGTFYTCIQEEGDALYVPAGWGHAVINLETSIGVAVEWGTSLYVAL